MIIIHHLMRIINSLNFRDGIQWHLSLTLLSSFLRDDERRFGMVIEKENSLSG